MFSPPISLVPYGTIVRISAACCMCGRAAARLHALATIVGNVHFTLSYLFYIFFLHYLIYFCVTVCLLLAVYFYL